MKRLGLLCMQAAVVVIGSSVLALVRNDANRNAAPAAKQTTLPPMLRRLVDAINAIDVAGLADLFVEEGTHEDVPGGTVARGRAEIASYIEGQLAQFQDARIEPLFGHQSENAALLEYTFSVRERETERQVSYRGVLVFELDGAWIRRGVDYYDGADLLRQLGQLETASPL